MTPPDQLDLLHKETALTPAERRQITRLRKSKGAEPHGHIMSADRRGRVPTDDPDFVALTLSNGDGWVAEFCDHCQATWFGIQAFPEPRPQPGHTVGTRMNHFDAFELRHRRARFTRNVSVALVVAVFSLFAVLGATTFGVL